jgi:NAD(P)-dependent dehydrogenase (short-subunit alcohol dehydrogenase family)
MWRQKSKTPICPDQPRLDGKLAIVTGGNKGIGFETTKGLAKRGAEVIILARDIAKSRDAIRKIRAEFDSKVHFIRMDLADIESVLTATKEIAKKFPKRKVDLLVANAGIATKKYSKSPQGYEKAFAVNVLGHHVLLRACLNQSLLQDNAHVISVAADIYILKKDCKPNYFSKKENVSNAYCQSKLGVMWWAKELLRKHPNLSVNIVHPGVVASSLGGESHGLVIGLIRKVLMLSPEAGAQTTLICATQPGIINGGYYHNTMGQIILPSEDPGADSKKAEEFWNLLEGITLKYLSAR